ncbi:hypothetical protein [Nocardioides bizhenqiangii]|uniref:Uncharacterized protein n=1 Tax=Nocardioides bizhenqiangii TaxID=3095076 RepID=A0ABZ0ZR32_9ACTN|nr:MULTISPECIES: hypothetical protein [unclassified Nocardioides]MDZ5619224.1 hypothetical protein [Nocardioides sp. HM23]WQQ26752.1 hypothetical protein SHK19_00630 [Nocardioides sp. HM61]
MTISPRGRRGRPSAAVGVLLTVALLLTATSPAAAEQQRTRDDRRDVVHAVFRNTGAPTTEPRPRNHAQDVVSIAVRYGGGRVRLALTVRDLPLRDFWVFWRVRTATATWSVGYIHESRRPEAFFERTDGEGRQDCAGLRARRVDDAERVVMTFPRRCIGPREWIRTGGSAFRALNNGTLLVDDARLDGNILRQGPAFGPRIAYN